MAKQDARNLKKKLISSEFRCRMSCSCMELEAKYGQSDCKCTHYREKIPDCICERESVSIHSPGPVNNNKILVRTLFKTQEVDEYGRLVPTYFRPDPEKRGFSVDRMFHSDSVTIDLSKRKDPRYKGFLKFISACTKDIRCLQNDDKQRLFCVYDSATLSNNAHADICQNFVLPPKTSNRKALMMEIAWNLRSAFHTPQSSPQTKSFPR